MHYRLLISWLGLVFLPALVCLDEATAVASGWRPVCAGGFRFLPWAAGGFIAATGLGLAFGVVRRSLAAQGACWLFASGAALATIAVLELLLARIDPGAKFHRRPAGATYRYDPDPFAMPGIIGTAKTTVNRQGVRGPEIPTGRKTRRILCIGGGATECNYLDDSECWTALLGRRLETRFVEPVWTGGVGYCEYGVGEHLRFVQSSDLIDQVDELVVLVGVNDLVRTLLGLGTEGARPPYWLESRPVQTAREWWNVGMMRGFVLDPAGEVISRCRRERSIEPRSNLDWDQEVSAYGRRCRRLAKEARTRGVALTLVAQPALWSEDLSPYVARRMWLARTDPPRDWELLRAEKLRGLLERHHRELQASAAAEGAKFLDASATMSGRPEHFCDDFLLSESGSRRLAELLAESIGKGATP